MADQPEKVRASFYAQQADGQYRFMQQLRLGLGLRNWVMSAVEAADALPPFLAYLKVYDAIWTETNLDEALVVHAAAPRAAALPPDGMVRIDRDSATGAVAVTGVDLAVLGYDYDRARKLVVVLYTEGFDPGEVGTGGRWARADAPSWLRGADAGREAEQRLGPVQVFVNRELVFQSDPSEPAPGAAAAHSAAVAFPGGVVHDGAPSETPAPRDEGPGPEYGVAR